jgi:WD40 repeat protein
VHHLEGQRWTSQITDVACIASSSAAPHHPRPVAATSDGKVKVWDGAELRVPVSMVTSVAVWTEHGGGHDHDRIATAAGGGVVKVYGGEAFILLRDLDVGSATKRIIPFQSAEGACRLLVVPMSLEDGRSIQIWSPEEGRLLHDGINRDCPMEDVHLFQSAEGRHLLAVRGRGEQHPRHPGDTMRAFLDVWDLGEAPVGTVNMRGAHKHG